MQLPNPKWFIPAVLFFMMFFYSLVLCHGAPLTASWYSVESCRREGTSGIMANGEKLNDFKFTAASWDYAFGTRIKVTNLQNRKSIIVRITDRGPARRLYRQGRVIDLSKGAFQAIAKTGTGIIPIKIEEI